MNTHIQIRNVSSSLHRKLKMRAAEQDLTLTDYVKRVLEAEVGRPTPAEIAGKLKKMPPANVSIDDIVAVIRDDRDRR